MAMLSTEVMPPYTRAPDPNSTPRQIIDETYRAAQERGESLAFSEGVRVGLAAAGIFLTVGIFLFEVCKYFE